MKITKADVGRKVELQNGKIRKIASVDNSSIPVMIEDGSWYYLDGKTCTGDSAWDIKRFVAKPVPEFTANPSQYAKRPLKANSQAYRFVMALLRGRKLTHQDFVRLLERSGIVSNSPQRRMSEARKWLAQRGVKVQFKLEGKKLPQHKRWFIVATAKSTKLLTEMKGYA